MSISQTALKSSLSDTKKSKTEKLIIILGSDTSNPMTVSKIVKIGYSSGLREIKKWNVSSLLGASKYTIRAKAGWELTSDGEKLANSMLAPHKKVSTLAANTAHNLRQHLPKLHNDDARSFVLEAISCFEHGNYRAAIVLSWVGAVAIVQHLVVKSHLTEFNAEARRRDVKWKNAKTEDDIGRMKEADLLDTIAALSIIGKNTKAELKNCLDLRNGCGHPNSLKIGETRTAAHIEILVQNIYEKF